MNDPGAIRFAHRDPDLTCAEYNFLCRCWAAFYHLHPRYGCRQYPPRMFAEWGEGGPFYSSFIWHMLDPPYSPLATEDDL